MAKNDGDWSLYRPRLSLKANSCTALHFICMNYVVKAHIKRSIDSNTGGPDKQNFQRQSAVSKKQVCQVTPCSLFRNISDLLVNFRFFSLTHLHSADACFESQLLYGFVQKHQAVVCAVVWHVFWQKVFNNVKSRVTSGTTISIAPLSYAKHHCDHPWRFLLVKRILA